MAVFLLKTTLTLFSKYLPTQLGLFFSLSFPIDQSFLKKPIGINIEFGDDEKQKL